MLSLICAVFVVAVVLFIACILGYVFSPEYFSWTGRKKVKPRAQDKDTRSVSAGTCGACS